MMTDEPTVPNYDPAVRTLFISIDNGATWFCWACSADDSEGHAIDCPGIALVAAVRAEERTPSS